MIEADHPLSTTPARALTEPMEDRLHQHLAGQRYEEAFALVVELFKDRIFRLAFSMLRDEAQAEDTTQDVLVKIWKALAGYRHGASISTWIYAITRNTCLTELRKRKLRPTLSLDSPEMKLGGERIPALESADATPGVDMDVQTLLGELPAHYRIVITLFYLEQKAYEVVATQLGIPLGTMKTLLFRARKELLRIASRRAHPIARAPVSSRNDPTPCRAKPGASGNTAAGRLSPSTLS